MLSFAAASTAFSGPVTSRVQSRSTVSMTADVSRRALLTTAAGALFMPLAAQADGANSAATQLRARGIYGSRIFALQGKPAAAIVEEKAAFTLFLSGAYRTNVGGDAKAVKKELTALSEKIVKTSASGGDAQADLKKFVALAKITDQYNTPLTIWNPTQRRNAGAPTTDTVMDQSGSMGYSFYQTLPGDAPGFKQGYSPANKK